MQHFFPPQEDLQSRYEEEIFFLKAACLDAGAFETFIPFKLLARNPDAEKDTRLLISQLLKFHAPWVANHLDIFGASVVEMHLFYTIFLPWNFFPQDNQRHRNHLTKLIGLICSSGQPLAACLLCASGLIMLQGKLLSCGKLDDLLEMNRVWVDDELYNGRMDSIWNFVENLATQTPQSCIEIWDKLLFQIKFDKAENKKSVLEDPSILSISPGEFVNILFRRAELRAFLKGEESTGAAEGRALWRLDNPECSAQKFRQACGLGLNASNEIRMINVKEESEKALAIWQLILVDCRSSERVIESGYRMKNSLNFDASKLPSEVTDGFLTTSSPLTALLDQLSRVRGRYIGFVGDEAFVKNGSHTAKLVKLCINRGFPKLFVITGGWNGIFQEILSLPQNYHTQLLTPTSQPKKLPQWTSETFKKIADEAPQVRESVRAFFEKESGNFSQATDVFKKKLTAFFGSETSSQEEPQPLPQTTHNKNPSPIAKALGGWWDRGLTEFGLEEDEDENSTRMSPPIQGEQCQTSQVKSPPRQEEQEESRPVVWATDRVEDTEEIDLRGEEPTTVDRAPTEEPCALEFPVSSQNVSPEVPCNGLDDDDDLELEALEKELDLQVQATLQQI